MTNLLSSAAKIVFVLVAITACAGFFMGLLDAEKFMSLAMMAFAFYFGTPSNPSDLPGSAK